jgi:hypothetical protein
LGLQCILDDNTGYRPVYIEDPIVIVQHEYFQNLFFNFALALVTAQPIATNETIPDIPNSSLPEATGVTKSHVRELEISIPHIITQEHEESSEVLEQLENEEPDPVLINAISNILVRGYMENQTDPGPMGQHFSAHNGTIFGEAGHAHGWEDKDKKDPNPLNRGFKKYDELSFLDQQKVS